MEWYKRLKLVFDKFRKMGFKLVSKTPTQSNPSSSSYKCFKRLCIWFQNPKNVRIVVLIRSGIVISLYCVSIRVVPYTKRKQFRLVSKNLDRFIESQIKEIMEAVKWKILSGEHPDSVKVTLIGKNMIASMQQGLRNEHLDGLNWEFLVVDDPNIVNAAYLPGGKVAIFSGLLKHFQTDAEIATFVGHEVGHGVAFHCHEKALYFLWHVILQIVLYLFFMPRRAKVPIQIVGVYAMYSLLLRLPLSRKRELEADYIGLMLMASAGYDPRVAPNVYTMLEKMKKCGSVVTDIIETHPSCNKRAKLLVEAMEEALWLYHK